MLMFLFGLVNGSLSMITFQSKKLKEIGCGYYLFTSSILSIMMVFLLAIKFVHLCLSQMEIIENRTILFAHCVSNDVLLKVALALNEWLFAFIAIERCISVMQGVKFNKKRSIQMAKKIIIFSLLLVTLTHIHDPIYRELIDDQDDDERRIVCFVRYPFSIEIYNSIITLVHFLLPLLINIISAFIIVQFMAHHRSALQSSTSFKEQLSQNKRLLFPATMLVVLGTPRLIMTFITGCVKATDQPWIYLFAYFTAFVPSMSIFLTFVLPSHNYTEQFRAATKQLLRRFRSR